jgi:hypothetical protein
VSGDVHTPTNAGPDPDDSYGTSAGAAGVDAAGDNPEILVGAAFAGGLVLATILKRLTR